MRKFENFNNPKVYLSIVLVFLFAASAILSFPGSVSVAAKTRITVHPNPAVLGKTIKIVGYNFPIGESVALKLDSTTIGNQPVGTNGQFTYSYLLPVTLALGKHTLIASDVSGDAISFALTIIGGIQLSPVRAIDGGSVLINGVGMATTTTFTITFDSKTIGSVKTTSTGTLSLNYTIPLTTLAGTHTFTAKDTKGDSSSATFTTISKVTLTPPKGFPGNVTKVTITGFAASSPLTITLGGKSIPGQLSISTYTNGSAKFSFTAPPNSAGNYTFQSVDGKGDAATAQFTLE